MVNGELPSTFHDPRAQITRNGERSEPTTHHQLSTTNVSAPGAHSLRSFFAQAHHVVIGLGDEHFVERHALLG